MITKLDLTIQDFMYKKFPHETSIFSTLFNKGAIDIVVSDKDSENVTVSFYELEGTPFINYMELWLDESKKYSHEHALLSYEVVTDTSTVGRDNVKVMPVSIQQIEVDSLLRVNIMFSCKE